MPASADSPYTTDTNLWGRSIEYGALEDGWTEPPAEIYTLSREPEVCAEHPAAIEIEFERGTPVAVNGVSDAARRADRRGRHDCRATTGSAGST